MQLFSRKTEIRFMSKGRYAVIASLALILLSFASLTFKGLNFGIDFTGGTLIELGYSEPVKLAVVRQTLRESGYERAVVHIVFLQCGYGWRDLSDQIVAALQTKAVGDVDVRRVEFVGPQVGEALREDGGLAVVYALIGILIYVALRFEYRFSFGSVIAVMHDVIITLAALLAVIGYSLNDTIVVYDRIRENFRKMRKADTEAVVNASINQTLARTLVTSLTTLLVLLALFFLGGEVIHGFAVALIVGVVVGTYSSIYVASTSALMLGVSKADLLLVKKEGAELEGRP